MLYYFKLNYTPFYLQVTVYKCTSKLYTCTVSSFCLQLMNENSNLITKVKQLEQSNADKDTTMGLLRKAKQVSMLVWKILSTYLSSTFLETGKVASILST